MSLREEIAAVSGEGARDRRTLYGNLLAADVWVRTPIASYLVTQPATGRRAVPAFLTEEEARAFWRQAAPGQAPTLAAVPFVTVAAEARGAGGVVLDPMGADLLLDRSEVTILADGSIPGEFAAWLRSLDRLGRRQSEVVARLRENQVFVLSGRGAGAEARLYLLEKSEDGTQAVPCFSSQESLAQFADVRKLLDSQGQELAVALVDGEHVLRVASGLGAYVLIDPESPWETQLEPMLI